MLQQINKENFNQMLGQFSTAELESMLEKFPYFQQAHLLLAKKYQQENSPKFDQQLQLAALYVQDRDLLYSLFNERNASFSASKTVKTIEAVVEVKAVKEKPVETSILVIEREEEQTTVFEPEVITPVIPVGTADTDIETALREIEESAKQLNLLKEEKQEEPVELRNHEVEEDFPAIAEEPVAEVTEPELAVVDPVVSEPVEEPKQEETEQPYAQVPIEEKQNEHAEVLTNQITENTELTAIETEHQISEPEVNTVIETVADSNQEEQLQQIEESAGQINLLSEPEAEIEAANLPVEEQKEETETKITAPQEESSITAKTETHIDAENPVEDVEEEFEAEIPAKPVFSRISPHTFNEWLKAFNNKSTPPAQTEPVVTQHKQEEPEDEEEDGQDELDQLLAVNVSADYLHDLVKEETTYARGLERFIEEQIQKHKQPVAKKQVTEKVINAEPATETMAKVYEMQKKYLKAIQTYEALTLKFPEKSSFFAARINYLRNII